MELAECTECNETKMVDAEGTCESCRARVAIQDESRPLRPERPCARCEHTTFVRSRSLQMRATETLGNVEAYICRKCGFTDLYVRGAADLPIGEEHGTNLVETMIRSPFLE
jgi:hypothetical protein